MQTSFEAKFHLNALHVVRVLNADFQAQKKLVKFAGAAALLCASVMSIYANMHALSALAITKYFYLLAVVMFAIEIRNDLVQKRFYLASGN